MYPDLNDIAKKTVKKDVCMKLYDASRPLYLETDSSGFVLGAGLLQVRDGMNCAQLLLPIKAYQMLNSTAS